MSGILMAHWDARDPKEHPGFLHRIKTLLHPPAPASANTNAAQQTVQNQKQTSQSMVRPGVSRGTSYQSVKSMEEKKPSSSGSDMASANEELARFAAAGRG